MDRTSLTAPVMLICGLLAFVTAAPHPVLSVTPTAIAVTGSPGAPVASATVTIRNAGTGALKWTIAVPTATWATVTPMRGTNADTLTISFPTTFGAAGTYTTAFVVSGAGSSQAVTVTVTIVDAPPPPPPPSPTPLGVYGPQPTIGCPAGAVAIAPGTSVQAAVAAAPAGTAFCLQVGVHALTSAITPKSGDTFLGEYGAILDGSGWTTTDPNQGAFRAHNQDIDDVTIRNLVIRNMPQRGIHAYQDFSDRWTIEFNEIAYNKTGLEAPNGSTVRGNYIHHNIGNPTSPVYAEQGGGYSCYQCANTLFEANEFAFNGPEQKIVGAQNVTFRGNYVHDDYRNGIWFDGLNTGYLVEGNRLEDEPGESIFIEISGAGRVRNNTVRRSGISAVFISASHDVSVTGNTLEASFRGLNLFVDCSRVTADGMVDLRNVTATDNVITVPTTQYAFGSGLGWTSCTSAQYTPYVSGEKNLRFDRNAYLVPSLTGNVWVWGFGRFINWAQWQAIPQDATGTLVAAHGE